MTATEYLKSLDDATYQRVAGKLIDKQACKDIDTYQAIYEDFEQLLRQYEETAKRC